MTAPGAWTSARGGPRPLTPAEIAAWEIARRNPPPRTHADVRRATTITHTRHNPLGLPTARVMRRRINRRAATLRRRASVAAAIAASVAAAAAYLTPDVPHPAALTVAASAALAYLLGGK